MDMKRCSAVCIHQAFVISASRYNPQFYECLANTFGPYRPTLRACPMAISNEQLLQISSAQGTAYESVGATSDGLVEVPTIAWPDFLAKFSID